MFITADDYRVVCSEIDLDIISQSNEEIRLQAEAIAMEEVAGYIRTRYDVDKAYSATDDKRSPLLIQTTVSIAIYYLAMWLPQFMASEMRQELYDTAINRLRDIQRGVFTPNLPLYSQDNGDSNGGVTDSISFGHMPKQQYDY